MKHTFEELLGIVYRYYPRGLGSAEQIDVHHRNETEEHARLVAARRRAATDERWPALLDRISDRFPEASVMNHSLHLPTGSMDACYSFTLDLPNATDKRMLYFHVSFLAPYYFAHGWGVPEIAKRKGDFKVILHGLSFPIRREELGPEHVTNPDELLAESVSVKSIQISFDLLPEEQPYAQWIAREIEATFGCEPMPEEVGMLVVPEVLTPRWTCVPEVPTPRWTRVPARLYDCLFTDNHEWVNPAPSEIKTPALEIDVKLLTRPYAAYLTVLAAVYHIVLGVIRGDGSGAYVMGLDGPLSKETALRSLAWARTLAGPSTSPAILASTHELEALVNAWDGEGAPSDAMVTWASNFLEKIQAAKDSES